jgi:hypothetical protein
VDTAGLDIQRYAAESVHAFFFFAQIALNSFATETGL